MALVGFIDGLLLRCYEHPLVLCVGVIVVVLLSLPMLLVRHDAQEPPILSPRIPIIGHLINMICCKQDFYHQLGYVLCYIQAIVFELTLA